jgi:hypothetical protein
LEITAMHTFLQTGLIDGAQMNLTGMQSQNLFDFHVGINVIEPPEVGRPGRDRCAAAQIADGLERSRDWIAAMRRRRELIK